MVKIEEPFLYIPTKDILHMTIYVSLLLISFALSLDAFAVSLSCGMKVSKVTLQRCFKIAGTFGLFQAIMPLLGHFLGSFIKNIINEYAFILTFSIFFILGVKTLIAAVKNSMKNEKICCQKTNQEFLATNLTCNNNVCQKCENIDSFSCLFGLAIATSIDAFLIGPILALYQIPLILSVSMIGLVTFILCSLGLYIGHFTGEKLSSYAEYLSGIILIGLAFLTLFNRGF